MTGRRLLSVVGAVIILLHPSSVRAQSTSWQKNMEAGRAALEQNRLEEAEKSNGEEKDVAVRSLKEQEFLEKKEELAGGYDELATFYPTRRDAGRHAAPLN